MNGVTTLTVGGLLAQRANEYMNGQGFVQAEQVVVPGPLERVYDEAGNWSWAPVVSRADELDSDPRAIAHRAALVEHLQNIAAAI